MSLVLPTATRSAYKHDFVPMMVFNRPDTLSNVSMDGDRYFHPRLSPLSSSVDLFPVNKGPGADPIAGNWTYDSAVDLVSLNPADMDLVSFSFTDSPINTDTKDLFMNTFADFAAMGDFTMPAAADTVSLSSDLDSDDQSWPTLPHSVDMTVPEQQVSSNDNTNQITRTTRSDSATSSTRWSSSLEMRPQEYIAPKPAKPSTPTSTSNTSRKARSFSQDSSRSSRTQDPQTCNAAKRAAHNIIEKRYRTNMNAKFLALENVISPAGAAKQSSKAGAGSLKKSDVLTNTLAYIESIQQENQALHKELALLKKNLLPGGPWRHSKQPRD